MARLLFLAALALALYLVYLQLKPLPAPQRRRRLWQLAAWAVAIALLLLVATGRVHWLGAIVAALLPVLRNLLSVLVRMLPFLASWHRQRAAAASPTGGPQQTRAQTDTLEVVLDHATNLVSGHVRRGPGAGKSLDDLDQATLRALWHYCQEHDRDACQLLETYLTQRFGEEFQVDDGVGEQTPPRANRGGMSRAEALAMLGLQEGASRDDIIRAHRQLMQKLHPDRGGTDYLAAQLNEAKSVLLGESQR